MGYSPLFTSVEAANRVFSGPASGSAAQPAFRPLVDADIPFLSQIGAFAYFMGIIPGTGTSVTITAQNPGTVGNSVALVFDGSTDISAIINSWNTSNPSNMVTLTSGNGSQIPFAQTLDLANGINPGSSLIGDLSSYVNFTPIYPTVSGALLAIDRALTGVSGSAITQLTGDGTAMGPGSALFTLANVNANVGTFTFASITVNAKGLITAASSGTTTSGTVTSVAMTVPTFLSVAGSPITSAGTLAVTLSGTALPVANGGTGQTTTSAAFSALSPLTTVGDLIYENSTPAPDRLPIGTTGQVLTVSGGLPSWASPATSGTVTSVAFADDSIAPIYSVSGSPVTSAGTLGITLTNQPAANVFAGPVTGSAAQPAFRLLSASDIPSLSATYVTQSEVGAPSGVVPLDGSGKISAIYLPSTVMQYQSRWNPNTNTPALSDGTGTNGYVYWVSAVDTGTVPGLTDPSMINFQIGDLVIYSSAIGKYELTTPAAGVSSVNGAQGAVIVNAINQLTGDVTSTAASGSQSKSTIVSAIQGTTVSGTTGTVNVVFSASPTFTGTITAAAANFSGAISASNFSGSSSGTNTGDQTITLTGDISGSGTGSFATTLATVNANIGTFGSSTSIPTFTVNAKGLITAASGNAVIAPAGTLSGTTLNATVVTSSLTSVGTITSGTWNSTAIAIANGGTGQTSKTSAFDALSPLTTTGDLITYNGTNNIRLGVGSTGQVLTVTGGVPTWASPATSGTVTSVALTVPAFLSVAGSPVTSSGTLAVTFSGTAIPIANGGTNAVTAASAFNNLNPMTTTGDLIYESATNIASRLAIGTTGQVLTVVGGIPTWTTSNAITALTGDGTATGPGSVAFTLATVNANIGTFASVTVNAKGLVTAAAALSGDATTTGSVFTLATVNANVGTFGSSTSIPTFTVNAKGLITAASGNAVIAPAGTLSGTALNSSVVTSSLTSVGTITAGVWNGTTIAIANGGTGQTTKTAAFDALQPMTTGGDLIYGGASGTGTRLGNGSAGQVLTSAGGTAAPTWSTPSAGFSGRADGTANTISAGATSKVVTFSSTLGTANYAVTPYFKNTVDANPQYQPINISAQSATGFTASWNSPTDSANYILGYIATVNV